MVRQTRPPGHAVNAQSSCATIAQSAENKHAAHAAHAAHTVHAASSKPDEGKGAVQVRLFWVCPAAELGPLDAGAGQQTPGSVRSAGAGGKGPGMDSLV
jgi:hypothetical protein